MEYRVEMWKDRKKVTNEVIETSALVLLKKRVSFCLRQHGHGSATIYDITTGDKVCVVRL